MRSGGPLKPLPLPSPKISSDLRELHKWPLAFRGEQLLHLLHISYVTENKRFAVNTLVERLLQVCGVWRQLKF